MKAIILAAGRGKRLRPFTDNNHKCLIEIGGRRLIDRYLSSLSDLGVKEIIIVVGYLKERIIRRQGNIFKDINIRYIINEEYERGSILSLWHARKELNDDVLILDGDVLFPKELLRRLISSERPNSFLMDLDFRDTGEEMKLAARGGRVIEISRHLHEGQYDEVGEGVGFLMLSRRDAILLISYLEDFIREGFLDIEYEDVLNKLVKYSDIGYEKVDGLPWIEIDFKEDIERGEKILPQLIMWD
ncbi:MAG: phosphocholine cytidylyltransferase family protein [Nitrospinae bacterium]|nr:phosphocholine cytidylyltransferase family protein [Nitrospinota bacterium]